MGISKEYVLGLDLGSASIGWALIEMADGGPCGILRAGVRVFDPGVDGDLNSGQEESKNKKRRDARSHRRQLRRRVGRQRDLFDLLQGHGMLPSMAEGHGNDKSLARHEILNELDQILWKKWKPRLEGLGLPCPEHVLVYALRARALDEPLEAHELGRVFYHLSQRRGFKSNRKTAPKDPEKQKEESQVYAGISELGAAMQGTNSRTAGEYFSRLDPRQVKIRRRWTAREMFLHEFGAIWAVQSRLHPHLLTDELKKQIHHLLYYQRPLMESEHLIGKCELEPEERRAPKCCLSAQRFRYLQRVNDLELELATGEIRRLTESERGTVIALLEQDDQTFAALRKALGHKEKGTWFNLERGGEKKLPGNRTAKRMREVFGEAWGKFSAAEQDEIVELWRGAEDPDDAMRLARKRWQLGDEQARKFAEPGEPDYVNFSRKALGNLVPLLEKGTRLQEAIKAVYPERFAAGAIHDYLPPLKDVRNPAVLRALTELRHLVNALVDEYGKPLAIRVELARDLKKPRAERNRIWKDNREREKQRQTGRERILKEAGIPLPGRDDIEKFMLAEECGWICPYTGKSISMESLFGSPQFEVEHILPLSRFPDNSFANKTLGHISANREKGNRTPYEAFHGNEEEWRKILERVKKFGSPGKLRRFQMGPEATEPAKLLEEFTARQLQDTRYASKMATQYLGLLYGGRDEDGTRKVFASSGQVTATLRAVWGLNRVLGEDGAKNRGDHRHHAVDALVIGVTDEATIKRMAEQAGKATVIEPGKPARPFRKLQQPWPGFVDSVRPHVDGLVVSHRPQHRLRGKLHEETLYGCPYEANGKRYTHVRKAVSALSEKEIEAIVDPAVKKAVQAKLAAFDGNIKRMAAAAESDPPMLPGKDGRLTPIRRVRIRKVLATVAVGSGKMLPIRKVRLREKLTVKKIGQAAYALDKPQETDWTKRHVSLANNHHVAIFERRNERDEPEEWYSEPVSLFEAMSRKGGNLKKHPGQPKSVQMRKRIVIDRQVEAGGEWTFTFSLMCGDVVRLEGVDQKRGLDVTGYWVVKTLESAGSIGLQRINDARPFSENRWRPSANALRELNCKKVSIDILGREHKASD
jgi:CRISPR-associated endonuclease Csn1